MLIAYIYIIGAQDNPVKVGRANNLKSRLISLQIGCPDELRVLDHVEVVARDSETIERLAHHRLREHHRRGEWFNVNAETAKVQILRAKRSVERYRDDQLSGVDKIMDRLRIQGHLDDCMEAALLFYRQTRLRTGREAAALVREMDSEIQNRAGKLALILFKAIFIERRELSRIADTREMRERVDVLLGNSITALYGWHRDNYNRRMLRAS